MTELEQQTINLKNQPNQGRLSQAIIDRFIFASILSYLIVRLFIDFDFSLGIAIAVMFLSLVAVIPLWRIYHYLQIKKAKYDYIFVQTDGISLNREGKSIKFISKSDISEIKLSLHSSIADDINIFREWFQIKRQLWYQARNDHRFFLKISIKSQSRQKTQNYYCIGPEYDKSRTYKVMAKLIPFISQNYKIPFKYSRKKWVDKGAIQIKPELYEFVPEKIAEQKEDGLVLSTKDGKESLQFRYNKTEKLTNLIVICTI